MPRSRKYDGVVYRRKETPFWWIRYRDRSGARRRESTFTQDWQEAQQLLRERLQARNSNVLDVVRKGEKLSLEQWADFFLENYSKPPVRAEKTHQVNLRVAKHLKNAFASRKLVDITADDIEKEERKFYPFEELFQCLTTHASVQSIRLLGRQLFLLNSSTKRAVTDLA